MIRKKDDIDSDKIVNFLRQFQAFESETVTETDLRDLAQLLELRQLKPETTLIKLDADALDVIFIAKGEGRVYRNVQQISFTHSRAENKCVDVGRIGPRNTIGQYAITRVNDSKKILYSETVVTTTIMLAYYLTTHDFYHRLQQSTREVLSNAIDTESKRRVWLEDRIPNQLTTHEMKMKATWDAFRYELVMKKRHSKSILDVQRQVEEIATKAGMEQTNKTNESDFGNTIITHPLTRKMSTTNGINKLKSMENINQNNPEKMKVERPKTAPSSHRFTVAVPASPMVRPRFRGRGGLNSEGQQRDMKGPIVGEEPWMTSTPESDIQSLSFSLVQLYVDGCGKRGPSALNLYVRHCGMFDNCNTAKTVADGLLTTTSLKLRLPLESYADLDMGTSREVLSCSWTRFSSLEAVPAEVTGHFLLFCRHTIVEISSFQTPNEILSLPFPPALKSQRQVFASMALTHFSQSIHSTEDEECSSSNGLLQAIRAFTETKCVATHFAHGVKYCKKHNNLDQNNSTGTAVIPLFSWIRISKSFLHQLQQATHKLESITDVTDVQDTTEWRSFQTDLESLKETERKVASISVHTPKTNSFWTADTMFPLDRMPRTGKTAVLKVFGKEVAPEKRLKSLEPDVNNRNRAIAMNETLCRHEELVYQLPKTMEYTRPGYSGEAEAIMKEVSNGTMVFRTHDTSWMKQPKRIEKKLDGYLFLERVKVLEALEKTPNPSEAAGAILRRRETTAELATKKAMQMRSSERKVRPGTAPLKSNRNRER